jgi:flagellin
VVTWGNSTNGGNSSAVAAQLTGGVETIYSNVSAFAALKADGSVVTWGGSTTGGNSSAVAAQLASGVQSLASPLDEELYVSEGTRVVLSSSESITFGGTQRSTLGFAASTAPTGDVADMRTTTATEATETLQRADVALQTISTQRARIGATLSRFDSLIGDLSTAGNNLTASRSRILDADYAAETAALTRTQIIQQAGQAMLAQANTNPRLILALLRSP